MAHMGGQPAQSGAQPAQLGGGVAGPPIGPQSGGGGQADAKVADQAASMLLQAVAAVTDPELKAALTSAAATLHKFVAADQKEVHAAMGGKVSPKMMARAGYGG